MRERDHLITHIKATSTALKCYDFATQEELDSLPLAAADRITELEDILSSLSLEADGLLRCMGINNELYRRGK